HPRFATVSKQSCEVRINLYLLVVTRLGEGTTSRKDCRSDCSILPDRILQHRLGEAFELGMERIDENETGALEQFHHHSTECIDGRNAGPVGVFKNVLH